jgi:hypothetical protein
MAGNIFSGYYGRRSLKPYLDQLPRVSMGQLSKSMEDGSATVFIRSKGLMHSTRIMRVRIGAVQQYRFICARCGSRCRILYLSAEPSCRSCTGARYRSQSESSVIRLQRRAYKILKTLKFDTLDAKQKKTGRHWSTHLRALQAAERAIGIIVERNDQIMSWLPSSRSHRV